MESPGFVIGNIAKGKDFWNRQEEIRSILKALEKSSVLLKSPRRFGKTSIMFHIYENPGNGYMSVFENTEGMHDAQDFIARLMTRLFLLDRRFWENIQDWLKKKFRLVDEVGFSIASYEDINIADLRIKIREGMDKNWQEKGFELVSKIKEFRGNILFILDELPLLVQNISRTKGKEAARIFLHWFRSVRQMPELVNVRWLVGGSIGIEHILNGIEAGTKVINDFHILKVGSFSDIEGRDYIKALLKTEGQINRVHDSVINEIMTTIGAPVPYFIQILCYEVLNEMRRRNRKTVDLEIIKKSYAEGVLGPASRTYFEHYFTRLRDYYDKGVERVAKRLILEVARQGVVTNYELFKLFRQVGGGELSDETFSYLMTDIENDFYVSYNAGTKSYNFTTNILRDWWLRYYDMVEE